MVFPRLQVSLFALLTWTLSILVVSLRYTAQTEKPKLELPDKYYFSKGEANDMRDKGFDPREAKRAFEHTKTVRAICEIEELIPKRFHDPTVLTSESTEQSPLCPNFPFGIWFGSLISTKNAHFDNYNPTWEQPYKLPQTDSNGYKRISDFLLVSPNWLGTVDGTDKGEGVVDRMVKEDNCYGNAPIPRGPGADSGDGEDNDATDPVGLADPRYKAYQRVDSETLASFLLRGNPSPTDPYNSYPENMFKELLRKFTTKLGVTISEVREISSILKITIDEAVLEEAAQEGLIYKETIDNLCYLDVETGQLYANVFNYDVGSDGATTVSTTFNPRPYFVDMHVGDLRKFELSSNRQHLFLLKSNIVHYIDTIVYLLRMLDKMITDWRLERIFRQDSEFYNALKGTLTNHIDSYNKNRDFPFKRKMGYEILTSMDPSRQFQIEPNPDGLLAKLNEKVESILTPPKSHGGSLPASKSRRGLRFLKGGKKTENSAAPPTEEHRETLRQFQKFYKKLANSVTGMYKSGLFEQDARFPAQENALDPKYFGAREASAKNPYYDCVIEQEELHNACYAQFLNVCPMPVKGSRREVSGSKFTTKFKIVSRSGSAGAEDAPSITRVEEPESLSADRPTETVTVPSLNDLTAEKLDACDILVVQDPATLADSEHSEQHSLLIANLAKEAVSTAPGPCAPGPKGCEMKLWLRRNPNRKSETSFLEVQFLESMSSEFPSRVVERIELVNNHSGTGFVVREHSLSSDADGLILVSIIGGRATVHTGTMLVPTSKDLNVTDLGGQSGARCGRDSNRNRSRSTWRDYEGRFGSCHQRHQPDRKPISQVQRLEI